MAKKNRELQRVPPENAQRAALRRKVRLTMSADPVRLDPTAAPAEQNQRLDRSALYGALRALLEHVQDADALAPASRGPKPKRSTLLRILAELEREGLPIRTSPVSPVVGKIADKLNLSGMQTRDLLHQLADMAEKLHAVDLTKPETD